MRTCVWSFSPTVTHQGVAVVIRLMEIRICPSQFVEGGVYLRHTIANPNHNYTENSTMTNLATQIMPRKQWLI